MPSRSRQCVGKSSGCNRSGRRPAPLKSIHIYRLHVTPPDIEWAVLNRRIFRSRGGPHARTTAHPDEDTGMPESEDDWEVTERETDDTGELS